MRISDQQLYNATASQLPTILTAIQKLQTEVTTGQRVQVPSDDPTAFSQAGLDSAQLQDVTQWSRNIDSGNRRLATMDASMTSAISLIGQIRDLALQAANGNYSAADRASIAQTARQLHRQLMSVANAQVDGQYVFAGTKTATTPYTITSGDTVAYNGNAETQSIEIGNGETVALTQPGSSVFNGTVDIFGSIANLLAGMESNSVSAIQTGVANLNTGLTQLNTAQATAGAISNRLTTKQSDLDALKTTLQNAITSAIGTDITQSISDLARQQTVLQAATKIAATNLNVSLLNYIP